MLPLEEPNIKLAFWYSLYNAGLQNAVKTISDVDNLIADDDNLETFEYYMSSAAFNSDFLTTFRLTRRNAMEWVGWWSDHIDRKVLRVDPKHDQTLIDYYTKTFKASVKLQAPSNSP